MQTTSICTLTIQKQNRKINKNQLYAANTHTRTPKITVIKQHKTNSALKIFFEKMGFEVCFEGSESLAVTD